MKLGQLVSLLPRTFHHSLREFEIKRQFADTLFRPLEATRLLSKHQKQHVETVFDQFISLPKSSSQESEIHQKYIDVSILATLRNFQRQMLTFSAESSYSLKLQRVPTDELYSEGFIKIYGLEYPLLNSYIHEFRLRREGVNLFCVRKEKPQYQASKQSADKIEIRNRKMSEEQKQAFKDILTRNDENKYIKSFKNQFRSVVQALTFASKTAKQQSSLLKADDHIYVDQITFPVRYTLSVQELGKKSQIVDEGSGRVLTKWTFVYRQKDAHSVKQNKRRILFDFGDWKKGNLIPIFNFLEQ